MTSEASSLLAGSYNANDFRVHPLSASPAPPLFSSLPPNNGLNNALSEDVTTIFVVGFPDDMQEREFQNIFMFSPGFEAASLKWHQKDDDDGTSGSAGGKKQMIGFARFRTRLEALEAVEVLSGKKIDVDKNAVLKAEMAKKNLHIKRGSVAPNTLGSNAVPSSSSAAAALGPASGSTVAESTLPVSMLSRKMSQSMHYDLFSPLPSDLLSPADYKNDAFLTSAPSAFNDSLFGLRSQSFDAQNVLNMVSPRAVSFFPPPRSSISGQEDHDPYSYLSKSSPAPNDPGFGSISSLFDDADLLSSRMGSMSMYPVDYRGSFRTPNPADQNPPCNTLYVGNLPPNTSEDELRQIFSKCRGYKRFCFRSKPQGPMCFVEFEDVVYATQALAELQGHTLSNSVKGGIRLSFSKNPLYIKPTKDTTNGNSNGTSNSKLSLGPSGLADRRDMVFDPQL
ncbi:uncharacterized protein BYT42DRAFT_559794 [Radiomyces spectabilis]|uniref:uncharacterized protein n=1 Tax=Radiomyces spectabilis TaxID=64574 RepID=UPI00222088C6|nr:uncharacterized protein BYT42DRAFT_559794 [Radiomyces spectabilis]KAI8388348.1 hypothetical protein BYT42DRAFT_559794 [Radiomyces spectabilis]